MTISAGKRLGPYEILEPIGAGGMGEVYKAIDLKLGRDVAIKVLPGEMASDSDRLRRFEQEARAASALNHPNIVTIYDIGKHGETPYIAMEFVEGKTFREMLSEGPLSTKKLLPLVTQIAEGLGKAHTAGIIHRDLKPENLMVSNDGYVKILDFGLAKLLAPPSESESPTLTQEGTVAGAVMGTVSYMSPEQALGQPLDARTDVFSLGAVLYEMATGTRPFQGETAAGLFDEVLHKAPPAPSSLNPELPRDFDRIIGRALEKDRELRCTSAEALSLDLNSIRVDAPLPGTSAEKSIVVLPFENISPDQEQEYFCDGITEEIISDLSKVEALRVISRSSAMTFKGTKKKLQDIADEVRVRYALEGSVRKAGNNLRITAQLIDASNDAPLWTEKYSGTLEDIFDIQEKVSRSIVGSLEMVLAPAEERKIAARPMANAQAYDCFLRARQEIARWSEPALDRALQQLEMASTMVGDNAVILAGLAYAHAVYYWGAFRMNEETLRKAEDYANRALHLDPELAQGHFVLGMLAQVRGRVQAAFRHLQQALSLSPEDPDTMYWLMQIACWVGKLSFSKPLVARLHEIDPLAPSTHMASVIQHVYEGQFEKALEPARTAFRLDPQGLLTRYNYFLACAYNQRLEEFEPVNERWQREEPEHGWPQLISALVSAHGGEEPRISDSARDVAWMDICAAGHVMPVIFSMLGKTEEALKWLERGVELGLINYPFLSIDPGFENIRGDSRFQKLMERVKHEWEHFEV
jgi:serine/threonine protein kinase